MKKQVAIVTGASRGIGHAVAQCLVEQDYHVVLIARNEEILRSFQDEIITKGGSAQYFVCDVTDTGKMHKCIDDVVSEHGKIDLLFNNAGILGMGTTDVPAGDVKNMLRINLESAIIVANKVASQMKQQKSGYIMNLSSIGGKQASSVAGIYCASKFGLLGYNESLTKEMAAFDVKVTAICPGTVATDMMKGLFDEESLIKVEDIQKTVTYLLSLSAMAAPQEIVIPCMNIVKKTDGVFRKVFGKD